MSLMMVVLWVVFFCDGFKRVRLTKKNRCPMIYRVSARPIPCILHHDPLGEESPGDGRRVARRVQGCSSPGSRLDRDGLG